MSDKSVTDPLDRATLRRLLAEATPGPWEADNDIEGWDNSRRPGCAVRCERREGMWTHHNAVAMCHQSGQVSGTDKPVENAALIAALRNSASALLDRLEQVEQALGDWPKLSLSLERDPLAIGDLLDQNQQERERTSGLLLAIMRAIPDGDKIPEHGYADHIRAIVAERDRLKKLTTTAEIVLGVVVEFMADQLNARPRRITKPEDYTWILRRVAEARGELLLASGSGSKVR